MVSLDGLFWRNDDTRSLVFFFDLITIQSITPSLQFLFWSPYQMASNHDIPFVSPFMTIIIISSRLLFMLSSFPALFISFIYVYAVQCRLTAWIGGHNHHVDTWEIFVSFLCQRLCFRVNKPFSFFPQRA